MAQLLALDLATRTGFAVLEDDGKAYSGVFRIAAPGTAIGPFLQSYSEWLHGMLDVHRPQTVVFEAPWVGPKTSQDTARKLLCLAGETERVAHVRRIPCVREVNNNTVRRHFIGKGNGPRAQMKVMTMRACRERGWDPSGDDEADALAVMDFAAHCLKLKMAYARTALEGAAV